MTKANTAPVPGATLRTHSDDQPRERRPASAERMANLLRRYPNIQDGERLELVDFIQRGHPDAIAQVTYIDGLQPRVIAFKNDHPEHFRGGLRAWLPWTAMLILPLLMLLLAHIL